MLGVSKTSHINGGGGAALVAARDAKNRKTERKTCRPGYRAGRDIPGWDIPGWDIPTGNFMFRPTLVVPDKSDTTCDRFF